MATELFIPPPEVRVRIIGTKSRFCLIGNPKSTRGLGHFGIAIPYDDHYWYIRPGTGQYQGQYLIVSAFTNRCLYVNTRGPAGQGEVGTYHDIGSFPDQFLQLQPGEGSRAGQFRIISPSVKGVFFSRTTQKPELGCIPDDATYDDQYFTFEVEPSTMVSIEYDTAKATSSAPRPLTVNSVRSVNDTELTQQISIEVEGQTVEQSTFQAQIGFRLSASASISSRLPLMLSGKVQVGAEIHGDIQWGVTKVENKRWKVTVPMNVAPGKTYVAYMLVDEVDLSVPYVAAWKTDKGGQAFKTKGIFKGISGTNLTGKWSQFKE